MPIKSLRVLLDSPVAFIGGLGLAIVVLGAALTSPIWFLVDGFGPVAAMRAGRPYELAGVVGLVLTIVIGVVTHRLRGETVDALPPVAAPAAPAEDDWKHRLVHLLVMLLFIVPFLTIVLGLILNQILAGDAG